MNRIFKKDQIFTLPNLLSVIRLMLIPLIVYLYCFKKLYGEAVLFIILSGATDIVDGFIARKFNMISDFGKILDPIADKLTQVTVIFCLATRFTELWLLVGYCQGAGNDDNGNGSHQKAGFGKQRKVVRKSQYRYPLRRNDTVYYISRYAALLLTRIVYYLRGISRIKPRAVRPFLLPLVFKRKRAFEPK